MRRRFVAGRDIAFRDVELRLVRDVAHHAGFGAGAEQGALRAFEDFDALEVRGIDIQVAAGQRARLFVEVDRDARKAADTARALHTLRGRRQAAHEYRT